MANILKEFAGMLAGGAIILSLALPASAIDIGNRDGGLGVSVDVLTPRSLPDKIRMEVLAEAVPI